MTLTLAKLTYLQIKLNETESFLEISVNVQNTHRKITLERDTKDGNKLYPQLFYQPLPFYGKNLNSPFWEN